MKHPKTPSIRPVIRIGKKAPPNHHLFNNNGTWWVQITFHRGAISERVRHSLKTRNVTEARRKRDLLFARLAELSHDQKQLQAA